MTQDVLCAYSALVRLSQPNPGAHDVTSPCPLPTEDLDGFLAWHRGRFDGARMEETEDERKAREQRERDAGKTYTQAELDRMLSREKDQGERAGESKGIRKALEQMGLDPDKVKPEDLKDTLARAQKAEEDAKTEAQREKDAAAAEKTASEKARSDADREKHETRVERLLLRAGLTIDEDDDKKRDKQIARAMKLIELEVGADSDKIRTAVDELKEEMPSLFGGTDDGGGQHGHGSGAPHSDTGKAGGSGRGGGQHGKGEFGAKGLEELKRRGYLKEQDKASA